jgi:uncharacterized protein
MSQPFKLYRLQQLDTQLDQARSRLAQIERILSDDIKIQKAAVIVNQAKQKLEESRKALHRSEEEVQAQRLKIELSEKALYGGKVQNPKELIDLQNEAASLKRYLAVLEDRQLENMMEVEEAEAEYSSKLSALEVLRSEKATQNDSLIKERSQHQKDVERMENERQAALSTIESGDIQLYEQLRQQRRGIAVARVADNTCAACGSTLTPSMIQAAHSPTQITRCAFCGRILYAG